MTSSTSTRRNGDGRILSMAVLLFVSLALLFVNFSSPTVQYQSQREYDVSRTAKQQREHVHVLFGVMGNAEGVFNEAMVALKSTLMNAPLDKDLSIHYMVDEIAAKKLDDVLNTTQVTTWRTRNEISINAYTVTDELMEQWKQLLVKKLCTGCHDRIHSFGAYFRLFAHKILPPEVKHALYMDTDVVVLTNLGELWTHNVTRPDLYFSWGEQRCSGFVVLNIAKMDDFWEDFRRTTNTTITSGFQDQDILRYMNDTFPQKVHVLPTQWDTSVANGGTYNKLRKDPIGFRPNLGMIHYNGGGKSKAEFWVDNELMEKNPASFGLTHFYIHMPWEWARFSAHSQIRDGEEGHRIRYQHHLNSRS